ncbi:MAG: radical SAM protein [Treponema sp.]|jgi:hypothetical protein|nr:radical SAM protein [Treponema sp.]
MITISSLSTVVCTTILAETSPQGLPLGAACIASAVKNNSSTRDLFSVQLQSFSREDTTLFLPEEQPSAGTAGRKAASIIADRLFYGRSGIFAVCFSVYVWNRTVLELAAAEIKKRSPKTYCIAGGPEITADPFSVTGFDFVCAGEGERAVPQLLSLLFSASDVKSADQQLPQGIYELKKPSAENHIRQKMPLARAKPCDVLTVSSPYLDGTIDPSEYGGALWELARGCPFNCSYCYESKGEKNIRYFPEERLDRELELFNQKKLSQVFVLDPTYNADRTRALKILDKIADKAPGMFFYFEARAEFIDRGLARAFTRIPCAVQIGLQSADPDVLALVHRSLNRKQFVRNVGYLNEAGTVFGFDLIYGLPGDSFSGFKKSIDFALSLYPNNLELFCLSVLPGTDLYDRAAALGLVWEQQPPYHVLHTGRFTAEDIASSARLSEACSLFYNQGRAVPWFLTVLQPLRLKPSRFFMEFADEMEQKIKLDKEIAGCSPGQKVIEKIQREFIRKKYLSKNLGKLLHAADDLIVLHGALSRSLSDGTEETVSLHYHADDLMTPYAANLQFFVAQLHPRLCTVRVFRTKNGADWKTV